MTAQLINFQRLAQQHLFGNSLSAPNEVVASLGAVQAQDYPGAKWAIGQRMQISTDAIIEKAFNDGSILRTHILRPTWHFVTPEDIRWMLELTGPRIKAASTYYYRQQELDNALFERSNTIMMKALQGGRQMTRIELGACLEEAGIFAKGLRLIYIIMHAELDGIICSGPRRGKQFTYMLLDERVQPVWRLSHDEALAELTLRYFTGHGPATTYDFAWWSGLTLSDIKKGLEMNAYHLTHVEIDGQTYWHSILMPDDVVNGLNVFLLPTYDEFLVGFAAFTETRNGGRAGADHDPFASTIVIGGKVAGKWRSTIEKAISWVCQ